MNIRELKVQELDLIERLISMSNKKASSFIIPHFVEELEDGKMGSIRFASNEADRIYSKDLIQVEYRDEDDILVIIALTEDNYQNLYELEFWKVNFEKLLRYPKPDEVILSGN